MVYYKRIKFGEIKMIRESTQKRKSKETDIDLSLKLVEGSSNIDTGVAFFDHMLTLFAKHSLFTLNLKAKGDTEIDFHHTVEDVGILLGKAFYEAAGDKVGIRRYGHSILPMDEALVETAIDFGGRQYLQFNVKFDADKIGDFDVELVEEFFVAFTNNAKINLHINLRYGKNGHHISEAIFKSVAKSLNMALEIISDQLPSTKGMLD